MRTELASHHSHSLSEIVAGCETGKEGLLGAALVQILSFSPKGAARGCVTLAPFAT